MESSRSRSLVPLVLLALVLPAGLLAWLSWGPDEAPTATLDVPPPPADLEAPTTAATRELELSVPEVATHDAVETDVVWPVEVELLLLRSAVFPSADGVKPIGSGATAILRGSVADANGEGLPVEVRFLYGPNRDRVLVSDSRGRFGATDLYPGLSVVEIGGRGVPGSVREVRLRQGAEELLNIGYGLPGTVQGTVFDTDAEPLEGVRVEMEGRSVFTDAEGRFYLDRMTAGREVPIVLSKDGYATYTEPVGVTAGHTIPLGRLSYLLREGATVDLLVKGAGGAEGETLAVFVPADPKAQRTFPWYKLNPQRVGADGRLRVEGLPPTQVHLHLFHEGAEFQPGVTALNLHPRQLERVEVEMKPAPELVGRVLDDDGNPAPGARVRLEAPDRVAATLSYFGAMPWYLEAFVVPTLPVAQQEVVTDDQGRFRLSAWSRTAPTRYLQAWSRASDGWACRLVGPDEGQVELRLGPPPAGEAELALDFPNRFQGLPLAVRVNGRPLVEQVLPPHEPLVLSKLTDGTWSLRAAWNGQTIFEDPGFELAQRVERSIALPEGAVLGQDEETQRRAGKPWNRVE